MGHERITTDGPSEINRWVVGAGKKNKKIKKSYLIKLMCEGGHTVHLAVLLISEVEGKKDTTNRR